MLVPTFRFKKVFFWPQLLEVYMPTGPFAALGTWSVCEHDGSTPRQGSVSKLTIVKATHKYIKYRRKCARHDPEGERLHHGKVCRWDARTFRVFVGKYQHIEATV